MTEHPYGTGSCSKHRRLFLTILGNYDLKDWVVMDRIRLLFIAEAGRAFTNQQIRRWLTTHCIACDEEKWSIAVIHKLAEQEAALLGFEYQAQQPTTEPE